MPNIIENIFGDINIFTLMNIKVYVENKTILSQKISKVNTMHNNSAERNVLLIAIVLFKLCKWIKEKCSLQ